MRLANYFIWSSPLKEECSPSCKSCPKISTPHFHRQALTFTLPNEHHTQKSSVLWLARINLRKQKFLPYKNPFLKKSEIFANGIQKVFNLSRTGHRVLIIVLEECQSNKTENKNNNSITLIWFDGGVNEKNTIWSTELFTMV
nr:hypothetical protein [Bartonella tribocorum]